jgi:hypothetical protein
MFRLATRSHLHQPEASMLPLVAVLEQSRGAKLQLKLVLDLSQGARLHLKVLLHHQSHQQKERRRNWLQRGRNWVNYEFACGCHELLILLCMSQRLTFIPVCEVETHFLLLCTWGGDFLIFLCMWGRLTDLVLSCTLVKLIIMLDESLWNYMLGLYQIGINVNWSQQTYTIFYLGNIYISDWNIGTWYIVVHF